MLGYTLLTTDQGVGWGWDRTFHMVNQGEKPLCQVSSGGLSGVRHPENSGPGANAVQRKFAELSLMAGCP